VQRELTDHDLLPEAARLENALRVWLRDMRDEQIALVKNGGRMSVTALAYEHILQLRGIIDRFMLDRKKRIQGRWDRRRIRRVAAAKRYLDAHDHSSRERCWCGGLGCTRSGHQEPFRE
jgi:hypothetical protein